MLTVITGPPCSGKSTYAMQHALPGDIIIDFDLLAQALGSPVTHCHDQHLREVAAAAWGSAINRAIDFHLAGKRAWIVDANPTGPRLQLYTRVAARIVTLTAARDELHRRADVANRPLSWHNRIDQYLDNPGQARPGTAGADSMATSTGDDCLRQDHPENPRRASSMADPSLPPPGITARRHDRCS